ncbi:phosphatase PAP2 family protein [Variovorax sp. PAMC26660]|uniref:phosphatase PAP2 family protein n=1 Tax=Variovorax sp. PAMC26660 TaxID=2762322 RepID=UPI00164D6AF0|nr:phosphatase PAP2 family protein [Variovorax sp. PAMC26660]QNK67145.1 phosphatase PAP2 family protein [Variovorax sp. PAMC26660]
MNEINLQLFHWIVAGEDPGSWALLTGCVVAVWGGPLCAAVLCWAAFAKPSDRAYILTVAMAAIGVSVISHFIAAGIGFQRPFAQGLVPGYILHTADGSMPSTHASVMFFITFAFMARASLRRTAWVFGLLAVATGWARIYVGVHFPADIAFGIALGAFLSCPFVITQRARLRHVQVRGTARHLVREGRVSNPLGRSAE